MSANCCVWSQSPPQRRLRRTPPPLFLHYIWSSLSYSVPAICLFPSSYLSKSINIAPTACSLVRFLSTSLDDKLHEGRDLVLRSSLLPQCLACGLARSRNSINISSNQSNLQIQCNPYQSTNGIFYGTRTNHLKICMETQKTPNSQSSFEGKKWSWRNQTPWLQTILQSYSNQDNMVLAQKLKHRSTEQDRKPRDKPTHLWSTNLWQRRQRYTMEKRQSLQ